MGEDREFDVTVYGATGFVGRLTAAYLADAAPEGTRIALAGRSREKLEKVRTGLGERATAWELVVAESGDRNALDQMAARTRVVATTVGPYRLYGLPLVTACAEAGTHYADLTGEVLFIRETIESVQNVATANGARIVHSCGFDSIPSDLGVLLLHDQAKATGNGHLGPTTAVFGPVKGGVSGGTMASLTGQIDEIKRDSSARRIALDPYALNPVDEIRPPSAPERDPLRPKLEPDFDTWTAPFIMSFFNTRVVRRSNAVGRPYGPDFRYREVMATGSGPLGAFTAAAVSAGLGGLFTGLSLKPTRMLLDRLLPDPGQGPSEKTRREGHFRVRLRAQTVEGAVQATVAAAGDPGYAATAEMLGEAALSLALDGPELPQSVGVLTPATGIGRPLIERLRRAGHTYESRPA